MAVGGAPGRPTREVCLRLLKEWGVPPHIRRHSERVAQVSRALGTWLADLGGERLDVALLESAALLHDLAKARCLGSRRDHAREGAQILLGLGYPEVADVVGQHVELRGFRQEGPVTEAEVLNYSDKRVRHEDVVSLEERFLDLLERYGRGNPEVERRIRSNWALTEDLERKLFARLPFGPERILELAARREPDGGRA